MRREGSIDRPGINHMVNALHRATWNTYTGKRCLKVKYINNTGAPSVRGEGVKFDPAVDNAVVLNGALEDQCIGAFAEDDVDDGAIAEIIVDGSVQFMLKNLTASVRGWVGCSDVGGRFDASSAAPIPARHWEEAGHSSEVNAGGTDILIEGVAHFN